MNAGCFLWRASFIRKMCHESDDQQMAAKCVHQTVEEESVSVVVRERCQRSEPCYQPEDSHQPLAEGLFVCVGIIYFLGFSMELM